MIVHRLCKAAHVALDGEGARRFGGRWNSPGLPMVYAAASPSLSVLEVLVHLDLPPELVPADYRLLTVRLPDDAPKRALDELPETPEGCRAAGDAFLREAAALSLQVPSAIVPQEANHLINPLHPAAGGMHVIRNEAFRLDPRLL